MSLRRQMFLRSWTRRPQSSLNDALDALLDVNAPSYGLLPPRDGHVIRRDAYVARSFLWIWATSNGSKLWHVPGSNGWTRTDDATNDARTTSYHDFVLYSGDGRVDRKTNNCHAELEYLTVWLVPRDYFLSAQGCRAHPNWPAFRRMDHFEPIGAGR